MGEPPIIPSVRLPEAVPLPPRMTLPVPSAEMPRYQPLVLPSAEQVREMRADQQDSERDQERKQTAEPRLQQLPASLSLPVIDIPEEIPQAQETTKVTLPGTSIKLTVPKEEVLTTAAATAGVAALASVAATMAAGPLVQRLTKILKPVMKTALKKLATVKGVQSANLYESDARRRWRQRVRTRRTMGDRV